MQIIIRKSNSLDEVDVSKNTLKYNKETDSYEAVNFTDDILNDLEEKEQKKKYSGLENNILSILEVIYEWVKSILILVCCIVFLLFCMFAFTRCARADYVLDEKIERFCNEHKEAQEIVNGFKQDNGTRCTLIGQAQIRFETVGCTKGSANVNNCFGLKRSKFLEFDNKTESIIFYVNRYYKYDKYKTISQIIKGGNYCSPVTGWCGVLQGYTATVEHHKTYYTFVKNYFHNNID